MEVYVNLRISNRCLMLLLQPVFLCQMAVHVCTCSICRLVWFSKRRSSTNQLTLFFFFLFFPSSDGEIPQSVVQLSGRATSLYVQ